MGMLTHLKLAQIELLTQIAEFGIGILSQLEREFISMMMIES